MATRAAAELVPPSLQSGYATKIGKKGSDMNDEGNLKGNTPSFFGLRLTSQVFRDGGN
jgi:hypothetical protein